MIPKNFNNKARSQVRSALHPPKEALKLRAISINLLCIGGGWDTRDILGPRDAQHIGPLFERLDSTLGLTRVSARPWTIIIRVWAPV